MRRPREKDQQAARQAASGDPDRPGRAGLSACSEPADRPVEARPETASTDLPCPGADCHVWHCDPDMEAGQ
jgi:hypothetical protein